MSDKNVKDDDIVERVRRLEEQVLPDGMNPSESVSGKRLADVLQGEGDEQPSFDAVDIKNGAVVEGSEVVTQADGVAEHGLGDDAVHSDATLAELNSRVSDAALRDEADFYDTDAGSIYAASFATASDVPTPLSVGTIVHVEDEDQLYQQKAGGFEKVSPRRDIAFKDRAETFAESDVTLSRDRTTATNEAIQFQPTGVCEIPIGDTTDYSNNRNGVEFVPNHDLRGVEVTIFDTMPNGLTAYLEDENRNVIASKGIDGGGTVQFEEPLTAGGTYGMTIDNGIDNYTSQRAIGEPDSHALNITGARQGEYDSYDYEFNIHRLKGLDYARGSVTIEWPQPDDIYRWDAATFQATLDNESADVYVEESTDGGATWTEIDGPINRGDMITAAADSEVRFRVELSRTDTSNNPTLDSIYRRYVV